MHLFADLGEVERLSDSSVPRSYDCNREVLIEVAITGRTVRDSLSVELLLSWDAEHLVLIARGEYDTLGLIGLA